VTCLIIQPFSQTCDNGNNINYLKFRREKQKFDSSSKAKKMDKFMFFLNYIFITLCLAAVVMAVSARPRFLAVPLEDIQFINGHPQIIPAQHRVRRDAGNE
jgi:hypothetical protein